MDKMEWFDWLRLLSACMCVFVLYKEGRRYNRLQSQMSRRLVDLYWVYLMAIFVIFYGSLEAIVLNAEGGPRSALAFVVVVVAFRTALHKAPVDLENDKGMT